MNIFPWLWLTLALLATALEAVAIYVQHRPGNRGRHRTLSANFSALVQAHRTKIRWVGLCAWGAFVVWFTLHIWGS